MNEELLIKKLEEEKEDAFNRFKTSLWHAKKMLEDLEEYNKCPPLSAVQTLAGVIASSAGEFVGVCIALYKTKLKEIKDDTSK